MLAVALATIQDASAKEVSAWVLDFGDATVPVGAAGDLKNAQTDRCLVPRRGLRARVVDHGNPTEGASGVPHPARSPAADPADRAEKGGRARVVDHRNSPEGAPSVPPRGRSALAGLTDRAEKARSGLAGLTDRAEKGRSGLAGLTDRAEKGRSGLTGLTDRAEKGRSTLQGLADRTETGRGALQGLANQAEKGRNALAGLTDKAEKGRNALAGLTEQAEKGRNALGGLTERAEKGRDALAGLSGLTRADAIEGLASLVQTDWDLSRCGRKQAKLLRKDPSATGPLVCGEELALQLGDECYSTCTEKPQQVGINICSTSCGKEKQYQWQIRGCENGEPVKPNTPVVLWNTVRRDSLVYGARPGKIADVCWGEKELGGACTTVRDE